MSAAEQIEQIYEIVGRAVPWEIAKELKPLPVDSSHKGGNSIVRGRIQGKGRRKIWGARCFYEIGIGRYAVAPGSAGGIGFVSYPNYRICGGGKHRQILIGFLNALVQRDGVHQGGKFDKSDVSDPFQGAFRYYSGPRFPLAQAASDLAVLVSTTFEDINDLTR